MSVELLTLFASAVLGAVGGFFSSRVHERLQRRDRLKSIASALDADISRIRSELGQPTDCYEEFAVAGTEKRLPHIHEWTEGLIVEASRISPLIISEYMLLERQLSDFDTHVRSLRETTSQILGFDNELSDAERQGVYGAAAAVRLKRERSAVREIFESFHLGAVQVRKDAWSTMERITSLLQPYLDDSLTQQPSEHDDSLLGPR